MSKSRVPEPDPPAAGSGVYEEVFTISNKLPDTVLSRLQYDLYSSSSVRVQEALAGNHAWLHNYMYNSGIQKSMFTTVPPSSVAAGTFVGEWGGQDDILRTTATMVYSPSQLKSINDKRDKKSSQL